MDELNPESKTHPWFVAAECINSIALPTSRLPLNSTKNCNDLIEVRPGAVYFESFQPGIEYKRTIRIINISSTVQRIYVYNPVTKWFKITSQCSSLLHPGMSSEIRLQFIPEIEKYYYDFLKIVCLNNPLDIPLYAFANPPTIDFPKAIFLPHIPIGECYKCGFPLKCDSPMDLEFELTLRPQDVSLKFNPMKGFILCNGEHTWINLTYQPMTSSPVTSVLQLSVPNLSSVFLSCKITMMTPEEQNVHVDADAIKTGAKPKQKSLTSLKEQKKFNRKQKSVFGCKINEEKRKIELKKGKVSYSHVHALGALKASKTNKTKYEEKSADLVADTIKISSKQMKMTEFLEEIENLQEEERRCLVHWHQRLGSDPLTSENRKEIVMKRQAISTSEGSAKDRRKQDFNQTKCFYQRRVRDVSEKTNFQEAFHFNLSQDMDWKFRIMNYNRFRKAVWKVIIRFRAQKRLEMIKKHIETEEWRNRGIIEALFKWLPTDASEITVDLFANAIFSHPNEDINTLHPDLHLLPQTQLNANEYFPLQPIQVEELKMYQVYGYKLFDVYEARERYLPPSPPCRYPDHKCPFSHWFEEKDNEEAGIKEKIVGDNYSPVLMPPSVFYESHKNRATNIFNPNPLLDIYFPLPSSHEFDSDYLLHPLVPWKFKEQVIQMDPQEVIKGAMTWNHLNFLSESFLNRQPVPSLPFSALPPIQPTRDSHLIPFEGPPLKSGLSEEDEQMIREIRRSAGDATDSEIPINKQKTCFI